jgi:hypothetical protein
MMAAVDGMASPHPEFQHHIEEMLNESHTTPQIVATLTRLGFKTSTRNLQ